MSRRLPPLNALRAFEAAARHLSFTRAADELHVTPGAVSHQVKALEAEVGQPLFRRMTRALLLTDAGQRALPALRDGFDLLARAVDEMRADTAEGELTLSVSPSIAALWLVPRLDRFAAAHPAIDLRLEATIALADFLRDRVDVAIRYGPGDYAGLRVHRLFNETVSPVCGPALLTGAHPIRRPEDLAHHTLLHVEWGAQRGIWPDWRMWLAAAGVDGINTSRGPRFTSTDIALQMAMEGKGVALGPDILVDRPLAEGRLVRPFELSIAAPTNFAYYLVYPESRERDPRVSAFRDWLLAECRGESVDDPAPAVE